MSHSVLVHQSPCSVVHLQAAGSLICNGGGSDASDVLGSEKSFIINKVAQLLTCACMVDYPRRWPSFFDDLVDSLPLGPAAVSLCLRVLTVVDGEVVDRDIAHTEQVNAPRLRLQRVDN